MTRGQWTMVLLSPFIGVLVTRIILLLLVKPMHLDCKKAVVTILKFWSAEDYCELLEQRIFVDPPTTLMTRIKRRGDDD